MSSKIRSRFIDLTDDYVFSGDIQVPAPTLPANAVNKDYVDTEVGEVSVFRGEDLLFTDTTNKVIPLSQDCKIFNEVTVVSVDGTALAYGDDYTIRKVAAQPYVCLSPSSTAPGGGSFDAGGDSTNPSVGLDGILALHDEFKVIYASAGLGGGGSGRGGGGTDPDAYLLVNISSGGWTFDPTGKKVIQLNFTSPSPLTSDGTTAITAGTATGQRIFVYTTGNLNQNFTLQDGAGTSLNGDWVNGGASILTTDFVWIYLVWNGSVWREISRSDTRGVTQSGKNSHSEGFRTTSTGDSSHAEGSFSSATGSASHAEGNNTSSTGNNAHAEGTSSIAQGNNSHAEGNGTLSEGSASHAMGLNTVAGGNNSNAEGDTTQSLGTSSHAEGSTNVSNGDYSHSEGINNVASGSASHAEGHSSVTGNLPRAFTCSGTTVTVTGGNWTGEFFNSDMVSFFDLTGGSIGTLNYSFQTISAVTYNSGPNNTTFTIVGALSDRTGGQCVDIVFGSYAHAEGVQTQAKGSGSHAEGFQTQANFNYAHAEGSGCHANAINAHAEGESSYANGVGSHCEGQTNTAQGDYSHVEGGDSKSAGNYSHSEGFATRALGTAAHSEGNNAYAFGNSSHVEGDTNAAFCDDGHAEGQHVTVAGPQGHAEGSFTFTSAFGGHAEGIRTVSGLAPQTFTVLGPSPEDDGQSSQIQIAGGNFTELYPGGAIVRLFGLDNSNSQNVSTVDSAFPATFDGTNTIVNLLGDFMAFAGVTTGFITTDAPTQVNAAHAEGTATVANGDSSHAEGNASIAGGANSHAEGKSTVAASPQAHSEGNFTQASMDSSHAEGFQSQSNSLYAHTEGQGTLAGNPLRAATLDGGGLTITVTGGDFTSEFLTGNIVYVSQMAGEFSTASFPIASVTFNSTDTVLAITSSSPNPFGGVTSGMVVSAWLPADSSAAHAEGHSTVALGQYSHAQGDTTTAAGPAAHSEGCMTFAGGPQGHAEGFQSVAIGQASHAEGYNNSALGNYCHAEGCQNVVGVAQTILQFAKTASATSLTISGGDYTNIFQSSLIAVCYALTGGSSPVQETITVTGSSFDGIDTTTVDFTTPNSTNIGDRTAGFIALPNSIIAAHVEGQMNVANASNSHAEGFECQALAFAAHAEGQLAHALNTAAHAEGNGTTASGFCSHAEGSAAQANGNYSHAQNYNNQAQGQYTHAEGYANTANGDASHVEGAVNSTNLNAYASHAEGENTKAAAEGSHVEGNGSISGGLFSHAEGVTTATGLDGSHSEGKNTGAFGIQSHAEGNTTFTFGSGSHAEGFQSVVHADNGHAEGVSTVVGDVSGATQWGFNGPSSIYITGDFTGIYVNGAVIRMFNLTGGTNNNVFALPDSTIDTSTFDGTFTYLTFTNTINADDRGNCSVVPLPITGYAGHAEGIGTHVFADAGHAEGQNTTANGPAAHAEGQGTTASGVSSHAEGQNTTASTDNAHAEGLGTSANGFASHAQGNNTLASGNYTHAEGMNSNATLLGQHSHGGGQFSSAGDIQTSRFVVSNNIVASATPTNLFLDGTGQSIPMVMPNFSTWYFKASIVAQSNPSGDYAAFTIEGAIQTLNGFATTTIITTTPTTTTIAASTNALANTWSAVAVADTVTGALAIQVTSDPTLTVQWVAKVETVETYTPS